MALGMVDNEGFKVNHLVSFPARAAYSHSASVGSRADCSVFTASFSQNSGASCSLMLPTGWSGLLMKLVKGGDWLPMEARQTP
jgi:hypothetical protein